MRKFTENRSLLTSVDSNDIDEIKRVLVENIIFLRGEVAEINNAIEYSINNSDFEFEKHRQLEVSNKQNKEDYFSDEKWNMDENFSRDRYDLLVNLYNETFANMNDTNDSSIDSSDTKNNDIVRKVVIGGAVIFAGFLIYKVLS